MMRCVLAAVASAIHTRIKRAVIVQSPVYYWGSCAPGVVGIPIQPLDETTLERAVCPCRK